MPPQSPIPYRSVRTTRTAPLADGLLAATLGLAGALAPSAAQAQQATPAAPAVIEYRVRRGDTCVGIARRTWSDGRRVDLIHGANSMGPPPHRLQEGTVLRLPRLATQLREAPPDAQVTQLRNRVLTFTPERADARRNDPLRRGNRVNTLDNSGAELVFVDETLLTLGADTLLVLFGATRDAATTVQPSADHTLVTGSLRARLSELTGRRPALPVATEGAHVRIEPGEAQVSVDSTRTTRVSVFHGRSQVAAQRRTVRVPAGYGSRVEFGQPPSPPRRLPAAPAWLTPMSTVVFAVEPTTAGAAGYTASYAGSFEAPRSTPAPSAWRVQVARDEGFHDLLEDAPRAAANTRYEARALAPGRYYVRVSAFDEIGLEGPFGPSALVWVLRPEFAAAAASDGGGYELRLPDGLLCALDGSTLQPVTGPLRVRSEGAHSLGCTAAAVSAAMTSVRFTIAAGRAEFSSSNPAPAPAVTPGASAPGGPSGAPRVVPPPGP